MGHLATTSGEPSAPINDQHPPIVSIAVEARIDFVPPPDKYPLTTHLYFDRMPSQTAAHHWVADDPGTTHSTGQWARTICLNAWNSPSANMLTIILP